MLDSKVRSTFFTFKYYLSNEFFIKHLGKDCFIVDAGRNGLFSWIGKKCTKIEKLAAINGVSVMKIDIY